MKSYLIECAEINYFTIEVDAEDENQARELARENVNSFDVIDEWVSEWDINEIRELDEDGCTSGPHKRDTDEKLEEEKGKECCPKGTPNCPGPGIPGKPAPHNKLSENEELEEGEKMPDKNNDGIPDFAQDGKGANDLGKAKGADSADEKEKKGDDKKEKSEKDLSNVPPQLRDSVAKKMKESKIQTPEQEKALYESRFNKRNEEIFDKLKKLWTK